MARRNTDALTLISQVRRTPEWKVKETHNGVQVYAPGQDKPVAAHHNSGGSDIRGLAAFRSALKRAGWTPELLAEAEEANRLERLREAMASAPQFSDAPADPLPASVAEPPKAEWVEVTSEMAAEWLERDRKARDELDLPHENRSLRRDYVIAWAREMASGRWMLTHEAIAIDSNGCIADGQHRLHALAAASTTVTLLVVTGVSPDVLMVCNTGIRRTAGDGLRMRKVPNHNQIAAALRLLTLYDHVDTAAWRRTRIGQLILVKEAYDKHPGIVAANKRAARVARDAKILQSAACAGVYIAQRAWPEGDDKLREFLIGVSAGNNLDRDDPRLKLRNFGINSMLNKRRRTQEEHLALFLKGWNAFAEGRSVQYLAWRGGPSPEPMPVAYKP